MPGRQERTVDQGDGMANIGKSIAIKGDLTGNEDLVIEGKVEGKVELPNNQLTIGANGLAKAEIHAKTVVVIGKVAGNVRGTERIEIQATGIVDGDVAAPRLVVAEGAVLNGSIQMTQKPVAVGAPAPAPALAAAGGSKAS
jgi:cytoskeletal protein CcmA (bactofilin family)